MVLVVKNQTFPPFGFTVRIISLIDIITYNIYAWFEVVQDLAFCHHSPQKNAKGTTTCGEGPVSFDLR
jgi:hypothetical protein